MFDLLALVTRKRYWRLHSLIIRGILQSYGIKVGRGFYIEGTPKLKIAGKASNISIGNNVSIFGSIDIRNRENGKIIIEDDVKIDNDCRFVSAREGTIVLKSGCSIGPYSIFNGGADIIIGKNTSVSGWAAINANEHKTERSIPICEQGYVHKSAIIGDDCLIGAHVAINKGVSVANGSVIGANSVVTSDTEEYSINAGIPARKIKMRD